MLETLKNVCMLATNHNVCKAYLARLEQLGVMPERIVFFQPVARNRARRVLSYVRSRARSVRSKNFSLSARSQPSRNLGLLRRSLTGFCETNGYVFPNYSRAVEAVVKNHPDIHHVASPTINDHDVIEAIAGCSQRFVIFCGGGILRKKILSLPKQFIHIHPGVVPDVKGADGILWSSLVHQRIGMSAFFMNEGIDTGDIIATREYDIPVIVDDKTQADDNEGRIADFIVNEVDPIFRADLLGRLFLTDRDPGTWQFQRQNPDDGKTYYFMHDQLKKLAIENWCDSRPA